MIARFLHVAEGAGVPVRVATPPRHVPMGGGNGPRPRFRRVGVALMFALAAVALVVAIAPEPRGVAHGPRGAAIVTAA